ncbi:MAG: translation initiation factor IF-3 [Verrucomicrobiia bacterium]
MSRPDRSHSSSRAPAVRINGKIRAREVRVIGPEGAQVGILPLHEAIKMARANNMDLVEVAPNATPPVCRIIDYGRYRYEQAKKEKESRKHQHASRVKEIQLSASIDPHDFKVKLSHAVDFLCDDMRVMVTLRFRGREMAHQEIGRQVVDRFVADLASYGTPVAPPRLEGKGIKVMITPLPRHKRAPNPRASTEAPAADSTKAKQDQAAQQDQPKMPQQFPGRPAEDQPPTGFVNNPFATLDGRSSDTGQN